MSRRGMNFVMTILAALALALPVAAKHDANDSKSTVKASMSLPSPASLAGTQLKAGDYAVAADDSKVTLSLHGKVVATAAVQWKDERGKAQYSTIVTDGNQIREIHFNGKTRYAEISGGVAAGK
jgi:hypothetical protein